MNDLYKHAKRRPFVPTERELAEILSGQLIEFRRPVKFRYSSYASQKKMQHLHSPQMLEPGVVEFSWPSGIPTLPIKCPWGVRGDLLWIREKWLVDCPQKCTNRDHVYYFCGEPAPDSFPMPWRPAVTMPRWAARQWLYVARVGIGRTAHTWEWVVEIEAI